MQQNPFDQFDAPRTVTIPLGAAKPDKPDAGYIFDPRDPTHTREIPRPGGPKDPSAGGDEPMPGDPTKTGKAYFDSLPPSMQGTVRQLLSNHLVLSSFAMAKPYYQQAINAASHIDPSYDPSLAQPRAQALKDFTGAGKASAAVGAVNRLAANLQELKSISDKMGGPNLGIAPVNKLIASVEQQGMPELRARYDALVPEIANQFDLIMKTKGTPTVSGIADVKGALDRARSQDERNGAFQEIVKAVHGAIEPIKDQWDSAYGGTKAPPMWISKKAGDFFSSMDPEHAGTYGGDDWRGLPGLKGDALPWQLAPFGGPPPPSGGNGGGGGNGGVPPAGPDLSLATGATKTELLPPTAVQQKVAAMLASGAPSANIRAYAKASDPEGRIQNLESLLAFRAMHPDYRGGYRTLNERIVPTTAYNRAAASPAAALAAGAADAATAGLSDEAAGAINALATGQPVDQAIRSADYGKQLLFGANPKSALAGNVLGGTAAMLGGGVALKGLGIGKTGWLAANPVKAALLGDTLYGAGYGAGENNDNRLLGAAVGGVTAPIASLAGQGISNVAGRALTGVVNPAVQRLRAAGIPLTAGEVLGGGWKKAQDAMTALFGPGDMVARRYAEGRTALNQAAFNRAGDIVDTPINAVGQTGVNLLDAAKSKAYSDALDPIQLDLNNPQTINDIGSALSAAKAIPNVDQASDIATGGLTNYIGGGAPNGIMSGQDFQQAYRGLSRLGRQSSSRIYGHEIGDALGQGKGALVSALQDQNPGAYEGFLKANAANRFLNVLSDAVNAAKSQVGDGGEPLFTPAQLGTAATANAKRFEGNIAAASGERPFNQLALDAQQVMSSKLPESGTAPRRLMQSLVLGGGLAAPTGALGYGENGATGAAEGAAVPLAALTLLGTRRGQQLLTASLLDRIAPFRIAGLALKNNPQIGGDLLTAGSVPLLTSPGR